MIVLSDIDGPMASGEHRKTGPSGHLEKPPSADSRKRRINTLQARSEQKIGFFEVPFRLGQPGCHPTE